jgi:hypothetical protein
VTAEDDVVRRELLFAVVGLGPAALVLIGATDPFTAWPVGVAAALLTCLTVAAADRLPGWRVVLPLATFAVVSVGFLVFRYPLPAGVVGVAMIGLNAGWALNRLVFGVVRPVPAPRLARESA